MYIYIYIYHISPPTHGSRHSHRFPSRGSAPDLYIHLLIYSFLCLFDYYVYICIYYIYVFITSVHLIMHVTHKLGPDTPCT